MSTGRAYAGESLSARTARRRAQLLDAALEVFGTQGYRRATVRALCREARVADRQFYQEFRSTEDLLLAVYHRCMDALEVAVGDAVAGAGDDVKSITHAGIDAFLAAVEADRRVARVVWFEVLGVSSRVEAAHLGRTAAFGELLLSVAEAQGIVLQTSATQQRLLAGALVGGISQTVLDWTYDDFGTPRSELVAALARLVLSALGDDAWGAAHGSGAHQQQTDERPPAAIRMDPPESR